LKKALSYSLLLILGSIILSCNPTRTLTQGEFLVNKNVVKVDDKNISTDDIYGYIKQKPNRRILSLFRFHLGVYNYAKVGKKESKLDKWIINTIGEPPVILDTMLTNKSVKQIKLYMNSKGYFNSVIRKEIIYKKKKAEIKYIVNAQQPYTIRSINYSIADELIKKIVFSDTSNSLILRGKNYDTDILQDERERITTTLKNDGYYNFAKEFITYDIDSALGDHRLDITLQLKDPVQRFKDYPDSVVMLHHKRYKINNINIYTDYNSLQLDTVAYKKFSYSAAQRKKTLSPAVYNFFYKDTFRIKPKVITQAIFFKHGDYYNLKDADQTYSRMVDMKLFKFVNVGFTESSLDSTDGMYLLDCNIQLTRSPVQSFSVETEATNSAGNLGVAGNLVYQSKNTFKGAEIFKFKIRGAMEIQQIWGDTLNQTGIQHILPFNTIETGAETGIEFPKFLMPIKQERFPKNFKPKTTIDLGINYQKRPDYTRYIVNVSYGYEWKESSTKKHILYPADVNSVKIMNPSEQFLNTINLLNDPKIKNSYKDHLNMALKYSFIFSNQNAKKKKMFSYFRGNIETSGNLMRAIDNIFKNDKDPLDGNYTLFNIKYSEYIRADLDYRHYFVFDEFNTLAFRTLLGTGYAYWNSDVLPFEKSFFAGGANSIRAWRIYSLGPGSCNDPTLTEFNRTGDIDMEANLEYRFPVYSYLKGSLFVDAGNIWLNRINANLAGADFSLDRFYKEFAVGAGFGARFDFSFFIMRLDMAIKLKDPALPESQRWIPLSSSIKSVNFNLGIGYPF
jgi:outer membrane protein assembly factor BamA